MGKRLALITRFLLGIVVGCALSALYYCLVIVPRKPILEPTTDLKPKVDTFIIYKVDTLLKPLEIEKRIVDTIVVHSDLGEIVLPREQKLYQGTNYKALVSGYKPSLDELYIFSEERLVREVLPPPKWNIGIDLFTIVDKTPSIDIGIGMDYRQGRFNYGASIGYDIVNHSPYFIAKARFNLYSHP